MGQSIYVLGGRYDFQNGLYIVRGSGYEGV